MVTANSAIKILPGKAIPGKGTNTNTFELLNKFTPNTNKTPYGQQLPGKGGPDPEPLQKDENGNYINPEENLEVIDNTEDDGTKTYDDFSTTEPTNSTPWGWIIGGVAGLGLIAAIAFGGKKRRK